MKRRKAGLKAPFAVLPAAFVLCALIISSCATSPRAGGKDGGQPGFSVLPPDADFYLWAAVRGARPLLEAFSFGGASGKDASQILERTGEAWAAFYPESAPRRFFFAGWGDYPNLRAGFSMALSRDWKKVKSPTGKRYWFSKRYNLGAALGPSLAFASDGDPFAADELSSIDPAPAGFEEFRLPCVMAGWFNNPETPLKRFAEGLGLPIQIPAEEFFIGIIREGEAEPSAGTSAEKVWKPVFMLRTASENQTRALMSLLLLAGMFRGNLEEDSAPLVLALLSNTPVQKGPDLFLEASPMSAGEISLLLETFSVYSSGLVSD